MIGASEGSTNLRAGAISACGTAIFALDRHCDMIDVARCFNCVIAMDETVKKLKSAYDAVAYMTGTYYRTHPDRLAVVAALHGIAAANVECCRVLEIGCASGSNLIPMAEQLPGSRFLGFDLSERQIETGSNVVRELELTNIELRCQDIMEFPDDAGQFDYIIAHGIHSWVPRVVQEKLFAVCHAHLTPGGIALVSYNAYPGWRFNEVIREMMLYRVRKTTDPVESLALGRQIVQFVGEHTPNSTFFRDAIRHYQKHLSNVSDRYLLHDHLGLVNDPRYFWQFIEEVKAHGLAYVGDSSTEPDPWVIISEPAREMIARMSSDRLEQEQYLDFLVNRPFRGSVLCREEAARETTSPVLNRMRDLYVAGNAPDVPAGTDQRKRPVFKFGDGDNQIALSDPSAIAVLRHLRRAWPSAVPFREVLSAYVNQRAADPTANRATEAVERLLETCHGCGLVELWSRPASVLSPNPGAYPRATRYARWQAANNHNVASLRHSMVKLDDRTRQLIPLLDGTRDRKTLAAEILRRSEAGIGPAWPHASREELDNMVDSALKYLADSRLILKEPDGG
jgi:SAM-dependent methyltransferase/methyltransferase-like protein